MDNKVCSPELTDKVLAFTIQTYLEACTDMSVSDERLVELRQAICDLEDAIAEE